MTVYKCSKSSKFDSNFIVMLFSQIYINVSIILPLTFYFICVCGGGDPNLINCSLLVAGIATEVVTAVDVNPVVNNIYCYNFGDDNHFQRNIQSFTGSELDKMKLDMITMSPPCQPFTRLV